MKASHRIVAIGLFTVFGAAGFIFDKRDATPQMEYDIRTIPTCTWWYDNYDGLTCHEVRDWMFAISPEDFSRWNPAITLDCGNWQENWSYCVEVKSEQKPRPSHWHWTPTLSAAYTPTTSATATTTLKLWKLAGWQFIGCSMDNTLKNRTDKAGGRTLTVNACEDACFSDGFEFAGLDAGTECWCGDSVINDWTENQDDCNIPCPGDAAQICGGTSAINVFKALTSFLPLPFSTPTGDMSTTAAAAGTPTNSTTEKPTSTMTISSEAENFGQRRVRAPQLGALCKAGVFTLAFLLMA